MVTVADCALAPLSVLDFHGSNNLNSFYYKRKERPKHSQNSPMGSPSMQINKVRETDWRRGWGGCGSAEKGA